jgi:hypothetical protein
MTWTGIIVGACDTLQPATEKRKTTGRPPPNQREISAKKPPNRARKLLFISIFIVLCFFVFLSRCASSFSPPGGKKVGNKRENSRENYFFTLISI